MKRPPLCCDSSQEVDEGTHQCNPQGTGTMARVRRFLNMSLGGGGRHLDQESHTPMDRSCLKSCDDLPLEASPRLIHSLRAEADLVLGKTLEDVMSEEETDSPYGVPSFVHSLCCYMLATGVDYEILVSVDWCNEEVKSTFLTGSAAKDSEDLTLPGEIGEGASFASGLLRLFLQEMPDPLLSREAFLALTKIRKDLKRRTCELSDATRIRSVLNRKLPQHSLNLIQYLCGFLYRLLTTNHNTCPVSSSALSRVLARALTDESKRRGAAVDVSVAEMLLINHAIIFGEGSHIAVEHHRNDDYSDNVSSTGETNDDERELVSTDDDDDRQSREIRGDLPGNDDREDESTTTSDTDDFRSPPVSPLNRPFLTPCEGIISRSTAELPDVESFHTKIVPFMKDCLPSITGFISAPDEPWKEEARRSEYYDTPRSGEGESSCLSGGEVSELEESEGSRDADGSETEGVGLLEMPCPHEERRTSERCLPRAYKHSNGRKSKRKTRRRHSKDSVGRVPSSEEEERDNIPSTGYTSSLSRDEEESVCSEAAPSDTDNSKPFRELIASNDPVQSDRSSWCLRGDASLSDNWQRTVHHYSREDDVKPLQSTNWYRAEEADDFPSFKFTDFSPPGLDDFLNIPQGQNAVKLLSKHISSLKKKIKKFEEEFEKKAGYRPSHQDKMKHEEIKKQMSALSRLKKELKCLKEEVQEKKRSSSKMYPMSLLRCQESTTQQLVTSTSSENEILAQDTLRQVEERLSSKRGDAQRPTELSLLSLEQYHDEKIDLQKALLYYEAKHGRPVTREDRDRVRPLYDRYRQVKRGIVRFSSRTKENIELEPILEGEAMDFTLASPQHRGSLQDEESECVDSGYCMTPMNPDPQPEICPFIFPQVQEVNLGDLHALPIQELKERKREAREMKKSIRCALREFEAKFEKETGRKMQKEDRGPMEQSYTEYKHVKAKLRLLEALLSKHSNSSRCDS